MGTTELLETVYRKTDRHLFSILEVTLEKKTLIVNRPAVAVLYLDTVSAQTRLNRDLFKSCSRSLLKIYHKCLFLLRVIEATQKEDCAVSIMPSTVFSTRVGA